MSDEQPSRPRRAMLPDEFETEILGDAADDTPTSQPSAARRGMVLDDDEGPDAEALDAADDERGSPTAELVQRPAAPLPVVAVPPPLGRDAAAPQQTTDPTPTDHAAFRPPSGRGARFSAAALPEDGPAASPRRSATSAHSPSQWGGTDWDSPANPKPQHSADRTPSSPSTPVAAPYPTPGAGGAEPGQPRSFRPGIVWAVGTLVVALIVMGGVYLASRTPGGNASVAQSPTSTSTTPSDSGQRLTEANLLTPEQATTVVPNGRWSTAKTLTSFSGEGTACMPVVMGDIKPVEATLRTLDSATPTKAAALHLLEQFTTADDAKAHFTQRAAKLASCELVPAHIVDSATVTGLGDEALQVTVALQEATTQFHTVFLVRTGSAVNVFGFANNDTAIPADAVLGAASKVIGSQCSIVEGACADKPALTPGPPPPTGTKGWLAESDLPRITPGAGRWTATDPRAIDFPGTGCENLAIGSVSGPTERSQSTYVLSQDSAAPPRFGVDEFLFTFPNPADAAAFAERLRSNIGSCTSRAETAKLTDATNTALPVQGGKSVGNAWTITLATGATPVQFQVGVGYAEGSPHVAYLVANSTAAFKFAPAQMAALAARAGQRTTQK